jgi:peroxiredoxin
VSGLYRAWFKSGWPAGVAFAAALLCCSSARAPDFELADGDGGVFRLSDYRGKVIALNFWATWCGPCKTEIPWLNELERKYSHRGFAVVAISMDPQGWPVVTPFLANLNVNYRVLIGDHKISSRYGGVDVLPTTFLIDRHGGIAAVHVGRINKKAFEKSLDQMLPSPCDQK